MGEQEQQPLQIAGHQDVHGRRDRLKKGSISIIDAGGKEVGQDVVGVGSAHQLAYGKTQALGKVPGQDVPKVARGNHEIHGIAQSDPAFPDQVPIGPEVIDHLGCQPADVDGVGGGEAHALSLKQPLLLHRGKDALDAGLSVVEVSPHRADADVVPVLGGHLGLLHGADPAVGVEDHDLGAGHVPKARHGSLAGVAAGGRQDQDIVAHAALFSGGGHEHRQHGQSYVLEGAGGSAEQLQNGIVPHGHRGRQFVGLELARIGPADQIVHLRFRKGRQQGRQYLHRHGLGG